MAMSILNPEAVFKCLGDETRLMAMLLINEQGELCVCELMDALRVSQPKVSRHLAQLRSCGLLSDQRRGQWVFYSLNERAPTWLKDILEVTRKAHYQTLETALDRLKLANREIKC